jgi:hypothetical protein
MMYGFRKDGVAVKLPMGIYDSRDAAIDFALKNDYLGVIYDNKYVFASNQSSFTKQYGSLRVLQTVTENAKLFTDTDESIKNIPFYFRGIFGISSKGELYTKLHTTDFVTAFGNKFKIYLQGSDVVFLTVESPKTQSMRDVMNDVMQLAAETHGLGKSVGLRITPTSTGYFNMKQ